MAKLVEILAKELKEWPGDWPALGQACDGSLHREPFLGGHTEFCLTRANDYTAAIVTRAEWQAAVDALKAKDAVAWDGVGLPPVGTKVEVVGLRNEFSPKAIEDWKDGDKVECVVHHGMQGDHVVPVFFNKRTMQFSSLRKDCYRPVRTPERIAAEEREAEVNRMVATVPMLDKGWARKVCYALYDNNYRKQEPR